MPQPKGIKKKVNVCIRYYGVFTVIVIKVIAAAAAASARSIIGSKWTSRGIVQHPVPEFSSIHMWPHTFTDCCRRKKLRSPSLSPKKKRYVGFLSSLLLFKSCTRTRARVNQIGLREGKNKIKIVGSEKRHISQRQEVEE